MTLTTAQQVRLRIQDQPRVADETRHGDGSAAIYNLNMGAMAYRNITSASAWVAGSDGAWSATGAAFDASGFVEFSGVISANSAWRWRGVYSTFSDEEISHFTGVGGNVVGAALEAVNVLRFDALKRAAWAAPDGTEYDDTAAIKALEKLYEDLRDELAEAEIGSGAVISWSEEQENW
jgi:hypothetical protein